MTAMPDRPYRDQTTEQVEADITGFERKRARDRSEPLRFKADYQAGIELSKDAARAQLKTLLAEHMRLLGAGIAVVPVGLGDLFVLGYEPRVVEWWHELVDAAPAGRGALFREVDRPEYEMERSRLETAIADRQAELRYRAAERALDAAQAVLEGRNTKPAGES